MAGSHRRGGGTQVRRAFLLLSGLLWAVALPVAALAQTAPMERSASSHPYATHIAEASQRFGIPAAWIAAVMRIESANEARAVSTAGAMGLMQIMPATWEGLRGRYGLGTDPFDVRANIMAGAAYLRELHDRYGNATAMLAAYNAGPGRYDDHLSRRRPLPVETVAYLAKLAAVTGGSASAQISATPPPDPFAWRRAALFVRMASSTAPVTVGASADLDPAPAGDDSADADAPSGRRVADDEVLVAQPQELQRDSLFVRRAGAARPQ